MIRIIETDALEKTSLPMTSSFFYHFSTKSIKPFVLLSPVGVRHSSKCIPTIKILFLSLKKINNNNNNIIILIIILKI
jgi:hypothetical protein